MSSKSLEAIEFGGRFLEPGQRQSRRLDERERVVRDLDATFGDLNLGIDISALRQSKMSRRPSHRAITWFFQRAGGFCHICGLRVLDPSGGYYVNHPASATRDHVFPRCFGGGNGGNLALAHNWCNSKKGHRTRVTDEFRAECAEKMSRLLAEMGFVEAGQED